MKSAERNGRRMTQNRRIFPNIVATYGRSLYARTIGLFCGRGTLMTLDMPKLTMEAEFS